VWRRLLDVLNRRLSPVWLAVVVIITEVIACLVVELLRLALGK